MTSSLKQRWRRWYNAWQADWVSAWPSRAARGRAWFDMLVFDHGVLRLLWTNFSEVKPEVYRANQPGPRNVEAWAKRGIRSVINLRGESDWGSYHLEREACAAAGIQLINTRLYSRRPPSRAEALDFLDAYQAAPKPVLIHCKSGADRAGLASAMILLHDGVPPEEAARQLSLRYLHIKAAKTGILDAFVAHFGTYRKRGNLPFRAWLEQVYSPEDVARLSGQNGLASFLVDKVLARE